MSGFSRRLFGRGAKQKPTTKSRDPGRVRRLRGDGEFSVKAAGSSHYQDALHQIKDGFRKNQNPDFLVEVVPEPSNPHDNMALQLRSEGSALGYIPASLTSEIHSALQRVGQDGQRCKVLARLVGHQEKTLGLRLNIERPARF